MVPDHLRTKKIFKNAAEKLPFGIVYVLDRYKTQEMFDNVIRFNKGAIIFF